MNKDTCLEQLAQELAKLSPEQQKFAADHLLGVVRGMQLAADLQKEGKTA